MFKGKEGETAVLADLLILILLHLRGRTGHEDNLTFTVLHLVKVVVSTMDKSIGEPMENHIPDGKRYACIFYISVELVVPTALMIRWFSISQSF